MTLYKLLFGLLSVTFYIPFVTAIEKVSDARINEVAKLGKHVMPFDLNQTLHVCSKIENGGVQQVIVKNPNNTSQITLIRQHLAKIANDFKLADFSDPEKIHGQNMPGLEALRTANPGTISIQYQEISGGAEITYTAEDPKLIKHCGTPSPYH